MTWIWRSVLRIVELISSRRMHTLIYGNYFIRIPDDGFAQNFITHNLPKLEIPDV